jgi:hypothetical protein
MFPSIIFGTCPMCSTDMLDEDAVSLTGSASVSAVNHPSGMRKIVFGAWSVA